VATLPAGFHYEGARVLADGDLVALHGVYHGFGPEPLVAFDLFRVDADGKLAARSSPNLPRRSSWAPTTRC
jgi:hypothetical protein